MNHPIRWSVFPLAFLGLGLSVPSCPGQQALQQQLDQLTADNQQLKSRAQKLESEVGTLKNEMAEVRTLLSQVANTVLAQKTAIEQLDASTKALAEAASKPAARGAAPKSAPKKR